MNGTLEYVDAAPVRAAINGRLLILDGIEKVSLLCGRCNIHFYVIFFFK